MLSVKVSKKKTHKYKEFIPRGINSFFCGQNRDMNKVYEKNISTNLEDNKNTMKEIFSRCEDLVYRDLFLGKNKDVKAVAVFTEPTIGNMQLHSSALGQTLSFLGTMEKEEVLSRFENHSLGLLDVAEFDTWEMAVQGFLSGDVLFMVEGYSKLLKIPDKGYPGLGVTKAETEKGARGSAESFSDSVKTNAALLRKRIRTPELKIKSFKVGVRSNTLGYIAYMEGIAQPEIVTQVEQAVKKYSIDRVTDSGVVEQLMEKKWRSPFPQIQSTKSPSLAAEELLEGRVVVIVDNSPEVLLLPAAYQSFLVAADDAYSNYQIVSMVRMLRYMAAFFAMTFPGIYVLATTFENQLLPTGLLLSFAEASKGTPFSSLIQVLFMEVSFELLREAGIRMPGSMGNAIGIVGGLIIGQAAVEAGLISPIVVIVVAFTALCSFSIPGEEITLSFRILKFVFLVICGTLGLYGFVLGLLGLVAHLASLTSVGQPYLEPVHSALRKPMRENKTRGRFANLRNRVRLRREEENEEK